MPGNGRIAVNRARPETPSRKNSYARFGLRHRTRKERPRPVTEAEFCVWGSPEEEFAFPCLFNFFIVLAYTGSKPIGPRFIF